jgi:hypothetical protein
MPYLIKFTYKLQIILISRNLFIKRIKVVEISISEIEIYIKFKKYPFLNIGYFIYNLRFALFTIIDMQLIIIYA